MCLFFKQCRVRSEASALFIQIVAVARMRGDI